MGWGELIYGRKDGMCFMRWGGVERCGVVWEVWHGVACKGGGGEAGWGTYVLLPTVYLLRCTYYFLGVGVGLSALRSVFH